MKKCISIIALLVLFQSAGKCQVTAVEYFIDDDPGFGLANDVAVSDAGEIDINFDVDLTGVDEGTHILHVRVKDATEKWSLSARKQFFALPLPVDEEVTAAEYFIGEDPGAGNGTSLTVSQETTVNQVFAVSTADLDPGMNVLHLRVQNSAGRWSLYGRRAFYILPYSFEEQVVGAEYFFGDDPGLGSGTPISVGSGSEVSASLMIDTDNLESGINQFQVRVRDNQGRWSLYARRAFYLLEPFGQHEVTEAEFFVDVDPGIGMATPITVSTGQILNEDLMLPLADTLMEGAHFLHLRIKNSNDKWSLYAVNEFEVDNTIGVDELGQSIEIWPNPIKDNLFFRTSDPVLRLRVIDMNGNLLRDESFVQQEFVNFSDLAPGAYLVQFFTQSSSLSTRVIKQ